MKTANRNWLIEHVGKKNVLKLFDSREEVEEFFNFMDRDYDGNLSFEVFGFTRTKIYFVCNKYPYFEEFMGEESTIEKLFKNMDKVKTKNKLTSKSKSFPNGQKLPQNYAQNGDGTVSREEFQQMCNNLSPEEVSSRASLRMVRI